MALSIGIRRNDRVQVGEDELKVLNIVLGHHVVVRLKGQKYKITEAERSEIAPQVYLSYGKNPHRSPDAVQSARLLFQAPREILIRKVYGPRSYDH